MVKQIIEIEGIHKKFKLNDEEKNLFLDAVNLLPATVYVRLKPENVEFLSAINNGDTVTAFEFFQKITWKDIAKRLIIETKRISKEINDSNKKEKIDRIVRYALMQKLKKTV